MTVSCPLFVGNSREFVQQLARDILIVFIPGYVKEIPSHGLAVKSSRERQRIQEDVAHFRVCPNE